MTGVHEVGAARVMLSLNGKICLQKSMIMSRTIIFSQVFFHAVFEQIHPFVDGNGRVGRTLMNDYFMIHDIAPTMIYHEDKHEHYKSLEAFDVNEDLDPLISFIEKEQEKTWSRTQKKGQRS